MSKASLPGILHVERSPNGLLYVHPREWDQKIDPAKNELKVMHTKQIIITRFIFAQSLWLWLSCVGEWQVVYDHGKPLGPIWDDFDSIRKRIATGWRLCPRQYDPISPQLHNKMQAWVRDFEVRYAQMLAATPAAPAAAAETAAAPAPSIAIDVKVPS